jgi:hypothetical protein
VGKIEITSLDKKTPEDAMTTLDLKCGDPVCSYAEPRASFFDWVLHAHASLRNVRALRAHHKRRVHLPSADVVRLRLRLGRGRDLRKVESCWA